MLFPLVLMAFAALGRRAAPWIAVGCVASFALAVWAVAYKPTAAFYLLPPRAWELGIGALLAYAPDAATVIGARLRGTLALLAIALLGIAMATTSKTTMFPGVGALAACIGAALLIWTVRADEGPAGRFLSAGPMVAVGLRSYGLYLWHWPVLALMRDALGMFELDLAQITLAFAVTAILSELSLRFVEMPLRRPGLVSRRVVFMGSGAGLAAFGAMAVVVIQAQGLPSRFDGATRNAISVTEGRSPLIASCAETNGRDLFTGGCAIGGGGGAPDFVVWGDSHAAARAAGFEGAARLSGLSGTLVWMGGCPPVIGQDGWSERPTCRSVKDRVAATLETLRPGATVFLHARWVRNFTSGAGVVDADSAQFRYVAQGVRDTMARLKKAGLWVILVGPAPEQGWHVPKRVVLRAQIGVGLPPLMTAEAYDQRYAPIEQALRDVAANVGAEYASPARAFCNTVCAVETAGDLLFFDSHHLSPDGALLAADSILSEVTLVRAKAGVIHAVQPPSVYRSPEEQERVDTPREME